MLLFTCKKVLIVAPHMDDEILGCAGTIILNREQILELIIVYSSEDINRKEENINVAEILKVNRQYCLHLRDGFVSQGYENGVCQLIDIIQTERPDIVFIPHGKDSHVDHVAIYNMAMDAIDKARYWETEHDIWKPESVVEYEVWSFQENVSVVVDISSVIEQKLTLMSKYKTQLKDYDYLNHIRYVNGYRGLFYNKKGFAECFMIRSV